MSALAHSQTPSESIHSTSPAPIEDLIYVNWYLIERPDLSATTALQRSVLHELTTLTQFRDLFAREIQEELLGAFKPLVNNHFKFYKVNDEVPLTRTSSPNWAVDLRTTHLPIALDIKGFINGIQSKDNVHIAISAVLREMPVCINWILNSHRNLRRLTERILPSEYEDDSGWERFKETLVQHIAKTYQFTPHIDDLNVDLIVGDVPLQLTGLTRAWVTGLRIRTLADISEPYTLFRDPGIFRLVVTVEGDDEGDDTVPEMKRYERLVKAQLDPPSKGSTPSNYHLLQKEETRVYDGRYAQDSPNISTIAPPIEIYSDVFGDFLSLMQGDGHQPSPADMAHIKTISTLLSAVTVEHETTRNASIRAALTTFFSDDLALSNKANPDGTIPNGLIFVEVNGVKIPILLLELKNELGKGTCDPTTQASLSMRSAWLQEVRKPVRDRCNCPTFLLAGGGAWLSVLGAVLTDKIIVQRLTDMAWLSQSSTEEARLLYMAARSLTALRKCLGKLRTFYQSPIFATSSEIYYQRFFPYPTSYPSGDEQNNSQVTFKYVRPLQATDRCVAFLARTTSQPRTNIVVKFVTAYGEAVHEFLAGKNHAPKLLYCGPLPHGLIPPPPVSQGAPASLFLEPLKMVVMDYVEALDRKYQPSNAREQVQNVLKLLAEKGYVFGDLRRNNILFNQEKKVQLIDFDWAGCQEDPQRPGNYAYYPYDINQHDNIPWHPDVQPLTPIRAEHDTHMLAKLF